MWEGKFSRARKIGALSFLLCREFDQVITVALSCGWKVTQDEFNENFVETSLDSERFKCSILSEHNEDFSIAAFKRFDKITVRTDFEFLYTDYDENFDDEYYEYYDHFSCQDKYPVRSDCSGCRTVSQSC